MLNLTPRSSGGSDSLRIRHSPLYPKDLARKYPVAKYMPDRVIEEFMARKSPVMISEISGVRSEAGAEIGLVYRLPHHAGDDQAASPGEDLPRHHPVYGARRRTRGRYYRTGRFHERRRRRRRHGGEKLADRRYHRQQLHRRDRDRGHPEGVRDAGDGPPQLHARRRRRNGFDRKDLRQGAGPRVRADDRRRAGTRRGRRRLPTRSPARSRASMSKTFVKRMRS